MLLLATVGVAVGTALGLLTLALFLMKTAPMGRITFRRAPAICANQPRVHEA